MYEDNEWKDLLIAYNGQDLTYDEIGNPLQYRDGMLLGQECNGEIILFLYDDSSVAYGMCVKNGTTEVYYYYLYNAQGDVIGIIDSAGVQVVEYTYSAWGELLSVTGSMADSIGQKNPLRYRGYYYDDETGSCYLLTRYYDPVICRFINADSYITNYKGILSNNLFIYCMNNPIACKDSNGLDAIMLLDHNYTTHLGLLVQDGNGKWWHYYWGAEPGWDYFKCAFGFSVKAKTWCVEYDGEIFLEDINESEQYSGEYEELRYLNGDFSDCINEMNDETEEYNLYSNNCSQKSMRILASADTQYSNELSKASKIMVPIVAYNYYKILDLCKNGGIVYYVGKMLDKIF